MFEVVLTFRRDFAEKVVDRYASEEKALDVAQRLSSEHHARIVRAWIRRVRPAKTGA